MPVTLSWESKLFKSFEQIIDEFFEKCSKPVFTSGLITRNKDDKIPAILNFNHEKDNAFCVGIDKLDLKCYVDTYLGLSDPSIVEDAKKMSEAFITNLGLDRDRVKTSIASENSLICKKQNLHISFLECARRADPNGTFIFYYAGHGYELAKKCILAPADFDKKNASTGISGEDLVQWLNEAECKAKNVLFIFDCCYAGNLGNEEIYTDLNIRAAKVLIMCGCAPEPPEKQKISSVPALGHSIFTFFLLDYLKSHDRSKPFEIEHAMKEIKDLCYALSFLLYVCEVENGELKLNRKDFQPCLIHVRGSGSDYDQGPANKQPITIVLHKKLPKHVEKNPDEAVLNWLQDSNTQDALKKLSHKASHSSKLQNGIVSILLHSSAMIHYAKAKDISEKHLLERKDIFLQIAIRVSNSIDISIFEVQLDHVIVGLRHYRSAAVKMLKMKDTELHELQNDFERMKETKDAPK